MSATPPAARTADFDLLLTDVRMPDLDGPALAAAVQRLQPGLRVLYMSGYSEVRVEDAELGWLLSKPFTPRALLERIWARLDAPADGCGGTVAGSLIRVGAEAHRIVAEAAARRAGDRLRRRHAGGPARARPVAAGGRPGADGGHLKHVAVEAPRAPTGGRGATAEGGGCGPFSLREVAAERGHGAGEALPGACPALPAAGSPE
jgi:CheY-like chemotaxis protein